MCQRFATILLAVVFAIGVSPVTAAEITAAQATIPKPTPVSRGFGALAFESEDAVRQRVNARQARVRLHHRPVPAGRSVQAPAPRSQPLEKPSVAPTMISAAPNSPIQLRVNRALSDAETGDSTGTVLEPTIAQLRKVVLLTGNWFAAWSDDGGNKFKSIDPGKQFPGGGAKQEQDFCCDQVAFAIPKRNLLLWFLQYSHNKETNTARLAVARGKGVEGRLWNYYDFSPALFGWTKEWFDYPDIAASDNYLYFTTNAFSTVGNEPFARSVVMRISLDELEQLGGLNVDYISQKDVGSIQAADGSEDTMYFGTHSGTTIRIYAWPEQSRTLQTTDVNVEEFSYGPYTSTGPDGTDWIARADDRITAGWQTRDSIGFAWTAAAGNGYPRPHVRAAIIAKKDLRVVAQPHVWSADHAYGYPSVSVNDKGEIGISLFYGGNKLNPSHAVGVYDSSRWQLLGTVAGTHGPGHNTWGDYLTIQSKPGGVWLTTGFTMQGGGEPEDISVQHIEFSIEKPLAK